jgi:hypothetical protein
LEHELPPGPTNQAPYLTEVLLNAGARYDRYIARRDDWNAYRLRRNRLVGIKQSAESLASNLGGLDILSHDDLASRLGPREIETLIGLLRFLVRESSDLANEVQKEGRARNLAEERWILEVADIYENAFKRPARVWGSGDEKVSKRRGKFYHLLEVSRPSSFPRYGKLSLRQVERILGQRRKHKGPMSLLSYLRDAREKLSAGSHKEPAAAELLSQIKALPDAEFQSLVQSLTKLLEAKNEAMEETLALLDRLDRLKSSRENTNKT